MLGFVRRLLGLAPPAPRIAADHWQRVERALPFLDFLAPQDRVRLRTLALEFLGRKEFHGAQGLRLNDDMLLAIALQACLPILNIGLQAYDGWVGVVVYPGDFIVPRRVVDEAGVLHEYDDEVLGEAWEGGPVLLSWFDDDDGPVGVNVVIHEFAHKLDMENGGADGLPSLRPGMSRAAWADAFEQAYRAFCDEVDRGVQTDIDPYGAEHPGEFFAVVSEAFFETPGRLRARFPAVYAQLAQFYGLDPAAHEARPSAPRRPEANPHG